MKRKNRSGKYSLSTAKAGEYIGISESTMHRLRIANSGPDFVKVGRRYLYRTEDLDKWIALNVHSEWLRDEIAKYPKPQQKEEEPQPEPEKKPEQQPVMTEGAMVAVPLEQVVMELRAVLESGSLMSNFKRKLALDGMLAAELAQTHFSQAWRISEMLKTLKAEL